MKAFDAASGRLAAYANGQQVASNTSTGSIVASSRNVFIGREDSILPRSFNGLIDEVSIYSRELTLCCRQIETPGQPRRCRTTCSLGPSRCCRRSSRWPCCEGRTTPSGKCAYLPVPVSETKAGELGSLLTMVTRYLDSRRLRSKADRDVLERTGLHRKAAGQVPLVWRSTESHSLDGW
jgi:hypothetical protein